MADLKFLENLLFEAATTISATSENPEFPASNLALHSRSKVWRGSGNFVIDSSNNKIDFNEGAGNLVATLSNGSYSPDALETEIKTQMEASGVETYTISFNTGTGKWSIQTGGGTLSLLWFSGANSANSVGSSIGFDTSSDDTGSTSYTSDFVAIHTEERVVFDLGVTPPDVDSFLLFFDKLNGNRFSSTAVVKLEANATDSWASPSVSQTLTFDSLYPSAKHFFGTPQSFRYWSIGIIDVDNPNLFVELSTIVLAEALELTQVPEIGFTSRNTDQSKKTSNDFGHEFYDLYPKRYRRSFDYKALTEADKNVLKQLFERVGISVPFGFALDTTESMFSDADEWLTFGRFREEFTEKHAVFNFFDSAFDIVEVI